MGNIYTITDSLNFGYYTQVLNFFSAVSIILAVLVITIKNPVISVLCLIGLFISIACYLISIGATFIGISYLLVYVGAVSILFLFILMLINIRVSELITETNDSLPLVIIVAILFENAYDVIFQEHYLLHYSFIDVLPVSIPTYNNWENSLIELSHVGSIGNVMYTNYGIWLILASIILLLAMVGAIVITMKQKTPRYEEISIKLHKKEH